jgi:hypothetical protein
MMADFALGLLGNILVGLLFVLLAWWKTDSIADRLDERRRVRQWHRIGAYATADIKRAALHGLVNIGLNGRWLDGPKPPGFAAASPDAWATLLASILARRTSQSAKLSEAQFRSDYEALVVYSLPDTRNAASQTLRMLDRVADRYSQTLPFELNDALLNVIAVFEDHLVLPDHFRDGPRGRCAPLVCCWHWGIEADTVAAALGCRHTAARVHGVCNWGEKRPAKGEEGTSDQVIF